MKTYWRIGAAIGLSALMTVSSRAAEEEDEPAVSAALREALFAEEADRDLERAEQGYRAILEQFDGERRYVASATLRLAELLRERGEDAEARALYARVVREFADQEAVAKVARIRLGGEAPPPDEGIAESRELGRLQKLLTESPDLLNAVVDGETPLERAAGRGEIEVVEYLLDKGAKVEGGGRTPYKALPQGEIVSSPLGRAVAGAHSEVVALLLEAGAPLVEGLLQTAANTGNLAVTRMLLDAGADPNTRFSSGALLHDSKVGVAASGASSSSRLPVLPRRKPPASSDPSLLTPLEIAARKDFGAVAGLLIERGARPQPRPDGEPSLALLFAVARENAELVALLLGHGADADSSWSNVPETHKKNASTLHVASYRGNGEIVELLLKGGANIEARTDGGETPLHLAHGSAVAPLIAAGAEVNARDNNNWTPLLRHPVEGAAAKARALLDAGADVNHVGEGGYTPLLVAIQRAPHTDLKLINLLIKAGADVTHSSDQNTPLTQAAQYALLEVIELLIGAGADPDQLSKSGHGPLHLAAAIGSRAAVEALLEAGADPVLESAPAGTPLTFLAYPAPTSGNPPDLELLGKAVREVAQLLLEADADIESLNGAGQTLLARAAAANDRETVQWLLKKGASAATGKAPAWQSAPLESEVRLLLFVHAQLEAEDRATTIRLIDPKRDHVVGWLDALSREDEPPANCPYSLFEILGFYAHHHPDLGAIRLWRMGSDEPRAIDLGALVAAADPASDIALQWGDVLEFPRAEADNDAAASDAARGFLERHLRRGVELVWRDQAGEELRRQTLVLYPGRWNSPDDGATWIPAAQPDLLFMEEGLREFPALPSVQRMSWRDDQGRQVRARRIVVTRGERLIAITRSLGYSPDLLPEDGDVITFEGESQVSAIPPGRPGAQQAAQQGRPPGATTRPGQRRVVIPPRG